MKRPELLAPAGNMECLKAAIIAGCDAVYLGGYTFGARSYATNFSDDEIVEAVKYAHKRGVKVYVTVNTIIYEDKFEMCINYIDFLHRNNVDAVIVQDIGLMDYLRKVYPNLEVHASTQMHIHNLEGAKAVESLGLKRTVLARETSIDDLKEIKKNTNIELEVFIHGALCVSYSGECLMSSLIGGRSGNLGTCSQCCRMKYDLISDGKKINNESYLLSMKDLNTINNIGSLIDIGIDSLKIEGRMKRKEYVYMVTKLYRKAIDNYMMYHDTKITENDIRELELLFNRKFTKGFLFNENSKNITHSFRPNHMGVEIGELISNKNGYIKIKLNSDLSKLDGIRIIGENIDTGLTITKMFIDRKEVSEAKSGDIIDIKFDCDMKVGSKVIKTTDIKSLNRIDDEINCDKIFLIDGVVDIECGKPITLTLIDNGYKATITGEVLVSSAINCPTSIDRIKDQLSRLGGTIYKMNNLIINSPDNIYIPITELNLIRRKAVELLDKNRLYEIPYKKLEYKLDVPKFDISKNMSILINDKRDYESVKDKNFDMIYTENIDLYNELDNDKVVLKLPRVINYHYEYNIPLLIGEMGSILKYKDNTLYTDFSFNVVNSYAVAFLHNLGVKKVTLSYELTLDSMKDIVDNYRKRYGTNPNLEVIVSSRPVAMISKFNLKEKYDIEDDSAYLKDSFGNLFPIKFYDNYMEIYHYKTIEDNDFDSYFDIGINNLRIHK